MKDRVEFMKRFVRFISFITVLVMFVTSLSAVDSAVTSEILSFQAENEKQERIDEIFSQMNSLLLEKYMLKQQVANSQAENIIDRASIDSKMASINNEYQLYELELSSLGVRKIDKNNPDDISIVTEMIKSQNFNEISTNSDVDYTDLEDIVDFLLDGLSVYRFDGTRTVNGQTYTYAYLRVVDDKGYDLYTNSTGKLELVNDSPNTLGELLQYNFEYFLTNSTIGVISDLFPQGWLIEWGLGNVATVLNSFNPNANISMGSGGIYMVGATTVTQMTYYLIYQPQYSQWVTVGSRASDVAFAISEDLHINVAGELITKERGFNNNFETGKTWYWYIDNFVNTNNKVHHDIGTINIRTNNDTTFSHTPIYYRKPGDAIW